VAILIGSANSVVDDSFRETLTRQFGLDKPLCFTATKVSVAAPHSTAKMVSRRLPAASSLALDPDKLLAAGKRLLTIFAVLWGAATLTFVAVKLIPGDPVGSRHHRNSASRSWPS
jgi:hypothetical protein